MTPLTDLRAAVEAAAAELRPHGSEAGVAPTLEQPKRAEHGDYATNAAMLLAPVLGAPPREIADRLSGTLAERLGPSLERAEVAGPGFLNLVLSDGWHREGLSDVLAAGATYGAATAARPERILVEFVSANPTGPLTAAGGRHAAYGDSIARLLELAGHAVEREYYINDFGSQVQRLGLSIQARARGEEVPPDGYAGDYVRELAAQIPGAEDADPGELAQAGVALMVQRIQATLQRFGVEFDTWFSERSLHAGDPTAVDAALVTLEEAGALFEEEGATWLRTTPHADDKDRVLRRSTGEHTYFASDIAYHLDKRARGFDRMIDVWGADHHGYVPRMKASFAALGDDPERLELVIMQFVNLIERGERASMSKRRGDFVTLDELIEQVGVDAARFFLLQRSHDTTVDLDIDLARERTAENPVYYVQYAHARIASIRAKAGEDAVAAAVASGGAAGSEAPLHPSERILVRKLLAFPGEAAEAAERRAPHRITTYALELAQTFTAFYRDCQVVGAEPAGAETFRLALSVAAQRVIAQSLGLLGVSAPQEM